VRDIKYLNAKKCPSFRASVNSRFDPLPVASLPPAGGLFQAPVARALSPSLFSLSSHSLAKSRNCCVEVCQKRKFVFSIISLPVRCGRLRVTSLARRRPEARRARSASCRANRGGGANAVAGRAYRARFGSDGPRSGRAISQKLAAASAPQAAPATTKTSVSPSGRSAFSSPI